MLLYQNIYELLTSWSPRRRVSFAVNGVLMGIGAPLGWLLIDLLLFRPTDLSVRAFLAGISGSPHQILLYLYMGLGTSAVMGVTGYLVGRGFDWDREKAAQLQQVHARIEEQKQDFEERFNRLQHDMSSLYQIGAEIQKSVSPTQVLQLLSDGAHRVLNFDRVNIFLLDENKKALECCEARGHGGSGWQELRIPLTDPAGALVKTIRDNRVYQIEDVTQMPADFRLGAPYRGMPELRSRSFACIPLREQGEPIGLIAVDHKRQLRAIRTEELSTLQILADQGSTALTNISLYQGVNRLHGELGRNFEQLLDRKGRLSEIIRDLSQSSREIDNKIQGVAENSQGLSSMVNETASSVHQMSQSMGRMASGVNTLSGEAQNTVSSTTEMGFSIREVESHAKRSNALSEQVEKDAEQGVSLVQESLKSVGSIQKTVHEAAARMQRLAAKTQEIGEVLEVINTINEKTNVLALNAAIISSQAGEHGKGFAVVSNEIRALSEQTASSSREIEQMIESVQEQVAETVSMIQSIPIQVDAGMELSQKSGEALSQILKSAASSRGMTLKIEQATREQVGTTELVTRAFSTVNEMIHDITRSIKDQSDGSRLMAEGNERMRQLTDEVAKANILQARDFQTVRQGVHQVAEMVETLFREAEQRKRESERIIEGIDSLDDRQQSA